MTKLITMNQKENGQYVNLYPQTDWSQVNGADAQIAAVNNSIDVKVANLQGQINQKQDASTAITPNNIEQYVAITSGSYTGNGEASMTINLSFTPSAVYVVQIYGYTFGGYPTYSPSSNYFYGGLAVTNSNCITKGTGVNMVSITTNGFIVYKNDATSNSSVFSASTNVNGLKYNFVAFK